jgi:hypothetical protein
MLVGLLSGHVVFGLRRSLRLFGLAPALQQVRKMQMMWPNPNIRTFCLAGCAWGAG